MRHWRHSRPVGRAEAALRWHGRCLCGPVLPGAAVQGEGAGCDGATFCHACRACRACWACCACWACSVQLWPNCGGCALACACLRRHAGHAVSCWALSSPTSADPAAVLLWIRPPPRLQLSQQMWQWRCVVEQLTALNREVRVQLKGLPDGSATKRTLSQFLSEVSAWPHMPVLHSRSGIHSC